MQGPTVSREQFNQILAQLHEGKAKPALSACERLLEQHPDDVNLLGLQGAILGKQGQYPEAESVLRRVTELAPTFAKPYEDLGLLLVRQQRHQEALPWLRQALRLNPKLEAAQFNLGRALAALGDGAGADAAFEAAFALNPLRRMMALATEHHGAGRMKEAEGLCRRILQQKPDHVDALRLLGLIAAAAGEPDEAEALLRQSLQHAPDHQQAQFDLGKLLREQERYPDAIAHYQAMLEQYPDNPRVHFRLGASLGPAARTEEAAQAYERCLALSPKHAGALLGLGHMQKTLGHQDAAIDAYRRCIAAKPGGGEAWYSLANLKTFQFSDSDISAMEQQLSRNDLPEQSAVNLLFALAMAWEARSDYTRAWQYFERGNAQQRTLVQYDPVQTEVSNNALVSFFDEAYFERIRGAGCADASPIFVLGIPRSGSTLVEQIIASHSQVEGTAELPYIGRITTGLAGQREGQSYPQVMAELDADRLESLGRDYLRSSEMHRTLNRPRFIDKMPNNFPSIGFIHAILPNARIIDARRHPMDACLGNLKQLYARGQTFSYDQTDMGEYYLQYLRMMDHWDAVLPGKVLRVNYEDTVADLESQVRRVLDFLELPFEQGCVDFYRTERAVRTASSEQVRQPIYTRGVGFWRHYAEHLGELESVLAPVRERYPW